jgi:hypothetical protein
LGAIAIPLGQFEIPVDARDLTGLTLGPFLLERVDEVNRWCEVEAMRMK